MVERMRAGTNADVPEVVRLVRGALEEFDLAFEPDGADGDVFDIQAHFADRGGAFFVLEDEGRLLGCVGIYPVDGLTCELRKLYLRPEARGAGRGWRLLRRALDAARGLGFAAVDLESSSRFRAAIALYTRAGFRQCMGPTHSPQADVTMRLDLKGKPAISVNHVGYRT